MLCHLPVAYPDELLYSVIARYIVHVGAKDASTAVVHIFGRKMIARVGLPGSLDMVSERTWPVWQMTGAEIANKLTLFPYYSHFIGENRAVKCLDVLRSNYCTSLPLRLGLTRSSVKLPKFLRFCNTCRENDLLTYGETYWHRSHQLAGVLVCPEHGERLIDTNAPMQPSIRGRYIDATLITSDPQWKDSDDALSAQEAAIALNVAVRCREILHGQVLQWPKEDLRLAYRRAAIERGFVKDLIMLSHSKIEKAFVIYYGTLLSILGCEVPPGLDDSWIKLIVRGYTRGSFHPVYHALFQVFLESVPVDAYRKIHFGLGPWRCPNRCASHKKPFPVRNAIYKKSRYGIEVDATCDCGLRFTFSRTCDTDPNLPVIDRIQQPVSTWQAEARLLRQCGLDEAAIADRLQLSPKTVKGLFNKQQNSTCRSFEQLPFVPEILKQLPNKKKWRFDVSFEQICQWRQEWLKLLDEVPNRSKNLARKKNPGLYQKLSYYDRDWFNTHSKSRTEITILPRVDWQDRDESWAPKLRAAALKIRSAVPLRRITRAAMISEAGLDPSAILQKLDRLPACRSALHECTETFDDYYERRLRTTMAKACQLGETLKQTQLLRRCSLTDKRLSSRLTEVLEELFERLSD
jgi:hypothetical protein